MLILNKWIKKLSQITIDANKSWGGYKIVDLSGLTPDGDGTRDFGTDSLRWRDGHFKGVVDQFLAGMIDRPTPPGCVLDLDMSEGYAAASPGMVYDKSGKNHDGTVYGAISVDGQFGKALEFDGQDDYVDASGVATGGFFGGIHTIVGWGKLEKWNANQNVMGAGRSTLPGYSAIDFSNADQKFHARTYGPDNENDVASLGTYTNDSDWHFFAIVVDADGHVDHFYIDLVDQGSDSTYDLDLSVLNKFYIGQLPYIAPNINCWKGLIDEARIYNRAVSAEEIRGRFIQGLAKLGKIQGDVRLFDDSWSQFIHLGEDIGGAGKYGVQFGADVKLWREAADVLKTDDNLDVLALRIGATEVITSARALQNLTAAAGLITSGVFDLGRIPTITDLAKIGAGLFTADATGRAKFADGFINNAKILNSTIDLLTKATYIPVNRAGDPNLGQTFKRADDANYLEVMGGQNHGADILLYGKDVPTLGGYLIGRVPNAAGTGYESAFIFSGLTDTPEMIAGIVPGARLKDGQVTNAKLHVDHKDAATGVHGVGSDYVAKVKTSQKQVLPLDGADAMTGDLTIGKDNPLVVLKQSYTGWRSAGLDIQRIGGVEDYFRLIHQYKTGIPDQLRLARIVAGSYDEANPLVTIPWDANPTLGGTIKIPAPRLKQTVGSDNRHVAAPNFTSWPLVLHQYSFCPRWRLIPDAGGAGTGGLYRTEDVDPGRDFVYWMYAYVQSSVAGATVYVEWDHLTSSGDFELWVGLDEHKKIIHTWSGEAPPNSPPIVDDDVVYFIKVDLTIEEHEEIMAKTGKAPAAAAIDEGILSDGKLEFGGFSFDVEIKAKEEVPRLRRVTREVTRQVPVKEPKTETRSELNEWTGKFEDRQVEVTETKRKRHYYLDAEGRVKSHYVFVDEPVMVDSFAEVKEEVEEWVPVTSLPL